MTAHRHIRILLGAAVVSTWLGAPGATTALADPPGYYFQDAAPSVRAAAESPRDQAAAPLVRESMGAAGDPSRR